ncbi:MAG: hypothetical protein EXS00_06730 [Phycisphaerales bacterium]|nr:hypothetical protein [Phycisphaerales bacterium]
MSAPTLAEITARLTTIAAADAASAGPHWGAMHKLLLKAKVDARAIMSVIGSRDLKGLQRMIAELQGGEVAAKPAAAAPIDPSELNDALRLFRRRLKFCQLDADSKLGVGPMTGGGADRIDSMIPPREFPFEVWEALVLAGKLRRTGEGFYSLVPDGKAHW